MVKPVVQRARCRIDRAPPILKSFRLPAWLALGCVACGARSELVLSVGGKDAGSAQGPDAGLIYAATLRPISPLSTSTVTSQTPLFRWALAVGDDGAVVDICGDRACTKSVTSFQVAGNSGAPPTALPKGVYYWRLRGTSHGVVGTQTTPAWEFIVGARSAPVNTSWGTTLDVNEDGFADIIVGDDGVAGQTGDAYVYLGGAGGLSTTPITLAGPADDRYGGFGTAVASAGDVNGDGFADVLVGSGYEGVAYLYLGGAAGLSTTPTRMTDPGNGDFGFSLASAGDVNGDGFADVVVGAYFENAGGVAYVYPGGPSGLSTSPAVLTDPTGLQSDDFGLSVASAGDVNGDGFADVVVGTTNQSAFVFLGGPGGLSGRPAMLLAGSGNLDLSGNVGGSVASAGDVNGDGFADVVVGVPLSNGAAGAASVYLGGAGGLSTTPVALASPGSARGHFGWSTAGAGDINGDGFDDIIVGAYAVDPYGYAYLYLGGASGPSTAPIALAGLFVSGGGYFGYSVAGAGDVNGDGFADVIIGDPNAGGASYLYPGGGGGLSRTPNILAPPADASGDYFGSSVASVRLGENAGDVGALRVGQAFCEPNAPRSGDVRCRRDYQSACVEDGGGIVLSDD